MVCQVDFCLEKGEKKICKILQKTFVAVPALVASFSMFYMDNLRGYLVCSGREEVLRFNTDNFLEDALIGGVVILLPLHHPFRVFAIILGRIFRQWVASIYHNVGQCASGLVWITEKFNATPIDNSGIF